MDCDLTKTRSDFFLGNRTNFKMTVTASDHLITTDGGVLFARTWLPSDLCCDTGPTILLFHDSLGCVDLWREFPQQLAMVTRRSVVAYDRLGFGRSGRHPGPLPLSFIRDEALIVVPRLSEALGLKAIIPFGHSVGGAMAIATAARWPERCVAVVTESAQSFVESCTLAGIRAAKTDFEQPGRLQRLVRYHGKKAHWVLDAWVDTWLAPAFAGWCLDDDLRGVRCPTLALHGDQDEYGSLQHPQRIARLTQGFSQSVILKACGHVPHRDQPIPVLREVTQFLVSLVT
jgi:pimeloyl-ACP methyl ester carboxylesterase